MPRQTKKLQTKATKGVIWARVSSREQEDGYSLDAQIENSKKYAERIGIEIIKTFEVTERLGKSASPCPNVKNYINKQ